MCITLDLPEDILRRARIAAVERGSSLRQLVIDALSHELEGAAQGARRRITTAPVKLAADVPLRTLSPDEVKRIDADTTTAAEVTRAR